ncbi:uncharacterized protein LOC122653591 isoform X3 [Telopea speciosissima]|uniref:uncharacterized protein LOC122653591 isoform X3 n=1 Tax=Telopea speciosissima TaxID=54955 RepID=UPI001CC7C6ED|nr:uncharacterized protein LOC122653591 isoform X3 [Telopea speciosissima]
MDTLDQTVHVLDLSPKVTLSELNTFFSYCGMIDKVQLVRNKDQSQMAYVTFRQPYALQTALLLSNNQRQGLIPGAEYVVQALALEGYEAFCRAKEELEERYNKLSEKGRVLTQQTRVAISAVEQTAEHMKSAIMSNDRFSAAGSLWLSGVKDALDKAAKCAADLGNTSNTKRCNPDSRMQ